MKEKVSSTVGGCWFCSTVDNWDDMRFDFEFDTNVHLTCIKDNLGKENEAEIMKYLLNDKKVCNPPILMDGVDLGFRTKSGKDILKLYPNYDVTANKLPDDFGESLGIMLSNNEYTNYIVIHNPESSAVLTVEGLGEGHFETVITPKGEELDTYAITSGPLYGYFFTKGEYGLHLVPLKVNSFVVLGNFLRNVTFEPKSINYHFNGCTFSLAELADRWEILL